MRLILILLILFFIITQGIVAYTFFKECHILAIYSTIVGFTIIANACDFIKIKQL